MFGTGVKMIGGGVVWCWFAVGETESKTEGVGGWATSRVIQKVGGAMRKVKYCRC